MASNASVIRPGLLVNVKTTVVGGVRYERTDLNAEKPAEEGQDISRWETQRIIEDKDEHDRAVKCRSQARALIEKVCNSTTFGLLCPTDQEGALDAAVVAARQLVDNYNATARHTRIGVYVLKGRVAADDAEAARAITQEVATLVQQMDAGIEKFDPKAIRDAADRARELSGMLSEEKAEKVSAAIAQARAAARAIVKRVEKEGEERFIVIKDIQRGQIESARIAFLDLSCDSAPVEATPATNVQRFADLDVDDGEQLDIPATRAPVRAIEVES